MSGNECTKDQLQAARDFLDDFATAPGKQAAEKFSISKDVLVRLLAWYGAVRFDACERSIGTLESPGKVELRQPEYSRGETP